MALAAAYSGTRPKRAVNALIISHFDSHGVAFAGARYNVLMKRGEDTEVISKFPETGPQGLSSGAIKNIIEDYAPQKIEIIDIPIDVRNPDAAIKTLADMALVAPIYYYDHHETDVPFVQRLHQAGIYASIFGDNVAMASALELFNDETSRYLAIIGMVADRDKSVLKIVDRESVEREYLLVANRLDVIVRQPQLIGCNDQGCVAKELVRRDPRNVLIYTSIEYPPERLAREFSNRIVEQGQIAIVVDLSDLKPNLAMWVPKTLEQMLLNTGRYIAIAIVPGFNPRTRTQEGFDVRVLRYWLAPADVPVPEDIVKDTIRQLAISGNVVGHADYVSLRFRERGDAVAFARTVYQRVEGRRSITAHFIADHVVANAVRRDYEKLYTLLERIAQALERGASAKEEQVSLLRQLRDREALERD